MGLINSASQFVREDFAAFTGQLRRLGSKVRNGIRSLVESSDLPPPAPNLATLESSFAPQPDSLSFLKPPPGDLAFFSKGSARRGSKNHGEESSWVQVKNAMLKFISSEELKQAMANSWKPLITAIQAEGATPQAYQQASLMLNILTPRVVRAITEQNGWSDFGKITARAGKEEFKYFYGRPNKEGCGKGFEVTAKILRGLSTVRRDCERIGEFLKVMAAYNGEPEILEAFCDKVGLAVARQRSKFQYANYNIFRLGRLKSLQIEFPPIERLPAEIVEEQPIKDPKSGETRTRKIVRGDSGQILTDEVNKVWDRRSPEGVFINGYQATMKVLLLANRNRFNEEALKAVQVKREQTMGEEMLAAFSKLEFRSKEADPESNKALESRLIARHQEALDYLKRIITEYKAQCASIKFGEVIQAVSNPGVQVASDAGGRLLGHFIRNLDTLEAPIKEVVEQLRHPTARLSKSDVAFYTQVLVAYDALHKPISKEEVYGALRRDLERYRKEYAGDKERLDNALAQLHGIEEEFGGKGETTIAKVGEVCQKLHFLYDFRVERGRRILARSEASINQITDQFKALFLDSETGQPLRDCQRGSVPLSRLRDTTAGKAQGRKAKSQNVQYVVNRDDWHALMTGILRWEACGRDAELFMRSMPVEDLERLTERFLAAGRKVRACGIGDGRPVPVADDLIPVEQFLEGKGLSAEEFLKRMLFRNDRGPGRAHCNALSAGLVIPGKDALSYYNSCAALTPAEYLKDEIAFAKLLIGHKFINQSFGAEIECSGRRRSFSLSWLKERIDNPFFGPGAAAYLKALYAFKGSFEESGLDDVEEIEKMEARFRERAVSRRVAAYLSSESPLAVRFEQAGYAETTQVKFPRPERGGAAVVCYTDKQTISRQIEDWNSRHLWVTDLSPEWLKRLAFLCTPQGAQEIERLGFLPPDRHTVSNVQRLLMDQASLADHSIAREFVDSIQSLDISIPSDFNPESGLAQAARQHCIGPNDLLIWVDGDPVINFDRHEFKGKKLLEVARLKPGKIWQWYAKFDFGLPEEECLHVRKIMWYLDKYHLGRDRLGAYIRSSEKFLDWLRRSGFDQVNYDPDTNKFSLRTH